MVDYLFQAINGLAGKYVVLDWLMIICAVYLVLALVGLFIYLFIKNKKKFVFVFFSMIVSWGIGQLIKLLSYTPRPFMQGATQLIQHVPDSSFPSNHAAIFFSVAFALFFIKKKKLGIVFLGIALLVSFARIFTGLHYPIDVVGGILVGFIGTLIIYFLSRKKLLH